MMNLIYLKVAKVGTQNADMTTSIERTVVTLESGKNFNNFVKHLHVQNFLTSEAEKPTIIKVVEWKDGKEGKEVDKTEYADAVNNALNSVKSAGQAIDYKALSEKQSAKISEMEQRFAAFEERLKASEAKKEPKEKSEERISLEKQANELGIKFMKTIGDAKLKEKIENETNK